MTILEIRLMDPYNEPIGGGGSSDRGSSGRHATDWGFGSLLVALTLLILFPMVLGVMMIGREIIRNNTRDIDLIFLVADVTAYGFVALAVMATLFGLIG